MNGDCERLDLSLKFLPMLGLNNHFGSFLAEEITMFRSLKISMGVLMAIGLLLSAASAQAQVRDAGSKIRGNADSFYSSRSMPSQRATLRYRSSMPTVVAQAPTARRSFSYDNGVPQSTGTACGIAHGAKTANDQAATTASQPTQGVRRYSYEPQMSSGTRSFSQPRASQLPTYLRADRKIRGEY